MDLVYPVYLLSEINIFVCLFVTKNAIKTRDVSIFCQKQSDYANNFHFLIRAFFLRGHEI